MDIDISTATHITRAQLVDVVEAFGLDASETLTINVAPDAITVTLIGNHTIRVPVVDRSCTPTVCRCWIDRRQTECELLG